MPNACGHDADRLPLLRQASYDLGSTVGRRPGILVTVHPGLLWRQVWGLATTSLPEGCRALAAAGALRVVEDTPPRAGRPRLTECSIIGHITGPAILVM